MRQDPTKALRKRIERWYAGIMRRSESELKQARAWAKLAEGKHLSARQKHELQELSKALARWSSNLWDHGKALMQAEFAPSGSRPYNDTKNRPKAAVGKKPKAPKAPRAKKEKKPTNAEILASFKRVEAKEREEKAAIEAAKKTALKAAEKPKRAPKRARAAAAARIIETTGHTAVAGAGKRLAQQVLAGEAPIPAGLKPAKKERKPRTQTASQRAAKDAKDYRKALGRVWHLFDLFRAVRPAMHTGAVMALNDLEAMIERRPYRVERLKPYELRSSAWDLRAATDSLHRYASSLFPTDSSMVKSWQKHVAELVKALDLPRGLFGD